jgi:hypothetical protein
MVENVEELPSELGGEVFLKLKGFGNGKVEVAESSVAEHVTRSCTVAAISRRDQYRVAKRIATQVGERGYSEWSEGRRFGHATSVGSTGKIGNSRRWRISTDRRPWCDPYVIVDSLKVTRIAIEIPLSTLVECGISG